MKKLKLLRLVDQRVIAIKRDAKRGNPAPQTPVKRVDWKCHLRIDLDENAVAKKIRLGSRLVLATNLVPQELDKWAILDIYKAQSRVEPGFRFIKSQTLCYRGSLLEKTGSYRRLVEGEVSVIAGLLHGPAEAMALVDCLWADYSNPDSAPDLEPEPEVGISTM